MLRLFNFARTLTSPKPNRSPRPVRFRTLLRFIPLLSLAACTSSSDDPVAFRIERESLSFTADRGSQVVSFTPADLSVSLASSQSWCSARLIKGSGSSSTIEVSVTAFAEIDAERSAEVTVTSSQPLATIRVKQYGAAPLFSVDEASKSLEFEPAAATQTVAVTTNLTYSAVSSATWCTPTIATDGLKIAVTANTDVEPRQGTVTVSAQGFEPFTVGIVQKGDVPDRNGYNVKGRIVSQGKGLAGIVVSDGFEVTQTDERGVYYLKSSKTTNSPQPPYVFISLPGNYEAPLSNQASQFYQKLTEAASVTERHDFELTPVNNERHVVLAMADLHLANRTADIAQFNDVQADVNATVATLESQGVKVYGLTLGDITWDYYWYSNGFSITNYVPYMNKFKCPIFNTIGNHDNDPYKAGDWEAVSSYRTALGPNYFSFNLGKAHYVVLDDIEYLNTGGAQGVIGQRNYNNRITAEQIEWLRKDLACVTDKSAPLFIALHIPVYKTPNISNSVAYNLTNSADLVACIDGFSNVHILSGHLHYNWVLPVNGSITEHNIAAICATWWWTGNTGYAGNHICKDGSVGGYCVFDTDGKDVRWYYKSSGYDRNYQFRTYDLNSIHITAAAYASGANADFAAKVADTYARTYGTASAANDVLINVFNYDPQWRVEVSEGATPLTVTRVAAYDPLHIISYECQRLTRNAEPSSDFVSNNSAHFFRVRASSATSTLTVKVTDRFGTVYTETMTRPKAFGYNAR